jgi:hypothetical protein
VWLLTNHQNTTEHNARNVHREFALNFFKSFTVFGEQQLDVRLAQVFLYLRSTCGNSDYAPSSSLAGASRVIIHRSASLFTTTFRNKHIVAVGAVFAW